MAAAKVKAPGYSTARAQQIILAAALITAVVYAFRRAIEPAVSAAPARGGKAHALAGLGSPPPALGVWAFAYGTGFLMLSVLSLGAPELAGGLAALVIAGELLTNGQAIAADVAQAEQTAGAATSAAQAFGSAANVAGIGAASGANTAVGGVAAAGRGAGAGAADTAQGNR